MTVQELIKELYKVDNRDIPVCVKNEYGTRVIIEDVEVENKEALVIRVIL